MHARLHFDVLGTLDGHCHGVFNGFSDKELNLTLQHVSTCALRLYQTFSLTQSPYCTKNDGIKTHLLELGA